ncbi:SAM-dependent methyltransferase [Oceanicola sp. 502str15]|uniref:SAM-dependent methyltransferase n=1 Tax=Oceanicola sp. 502str15 TaxID=2696061 RepID=UPI002095AEFA|nr:SAM-dependent methyltransferase [Oceanicola sp. 502str15]MCO6384220.1 SAM-dependent methyltransferase [Oceanicola sp. 502str15]
MAQPPKLTDRKALAQNRARAERDALFLHGQAIDEIKERLSEVNRTFTAPCVVTGFPEIWGEAFPEARVIEDGELLDIGRGAHDLVIHAMALHWASDPVGQLVQARRGLVPDGLFMGAMLGGETLAGLRTALAEAEAAETGGLSPRVLPMGEIRDLGALLQRAGFVLPVADALPLDVSYVDTLALMRDLRAMGEANAMEARLRVPTRRGVLLRAAVAHDATTATGDGRISARFETVFLTGWSPGPDQPQPLRPGSATARLADALGTKEHGEDGGKR